MTTDDRILLKSIARRMIAEAGPCRPSVRELPGGLIVRYFAAGSNRQLTMTSPHPGPTPVQREQMRRAFDVPGTAFEMKAPGESQVIVSLEWELSGDCQVDVRETALAMYDGRPCRICGQPITREDVDKAVFAGDDEPMLAHGDCWAGCNVKEGA